MTWVKWDDATGEHRKTRRLLRSAGLGAFGLHTLGVLHASRYLTDGVVEREFSVETFELARTKPREQASVIEGLVRSGLWLPTDDGWLIHDYLDHNPSRAQVLEARRKDADRKAAGRRPDSGGSLRAVR